MQPDKDFPVGPGNAKTIHLNEFKIHIVLGQIIVSSSDYMYLCMLAEQASFGAPVLS